MAGHRPPRPLTSTHRDRPARRTGRCHCRRSARPGRVRRGRRGLVDLDPVPLGFPPPAAGRHAVRAPREGRVRRQPRLDPLPRLGRSEANARRADDLGELRSPLHAYRAAERAREGPLSRDRGTARRLESTQHARLQGRVTDDTGRPRQVACVESVTIFPREQRCLTPVFTSRCLLPRESGTSPLPAPSKAVRPDPGSTT